MIGDCLCVFQYNRSTTDNISQIYQVPDKKWDYTGQNILSYLKTRGACGMNEWNNKCTEVRETDGKNHLEDLPLDGTVIKNVSYPFKAQWELYAPPTSTISNCAFCIYGCCAILRVDTDLFP
jgi:hypothetical protein